MLIPIKHSVAVAIFKGDQVLSTRRPEDDDELPGIRSHKSEVFSNHFSVFRPLLSYQVRFCFLIANFSIERRRRGTPVLCRIARHARNFVETFNRVHIFGGLKIVAPVAAVPGISDFSKVRRSCESMMRLN